MHTDQPWRKPARTQRRREPEHLTSEVKPCGTHEDLRVRQLQRRRHPSPQESLFTVADFAEIMDVVPKTVRKWIDTKKLKAFGEGRIIRITPKAAKEFIRKHIK